VTLVRGGERLEQGAVDGAAARERVDADADADADPELAGVIEEVWLSRRQWFALPEGAGASAGVDGEEAEPRRSRGEPRGEAEDDMLARDPRGAERELDVRGTADPQAIAAMDHGGLLGPPNEAETAWSGERGLEGGEALAEGESADAVVVAAAEGAARLCSSKRLWARRR
jgi:hypothetical protein